MVLDVLNPNSNVLNFEWTTGTNNGTNAAISYQFQITNEDSNFESGITYELGKNTTSIVYTNETLNSVLLDSLNAKSDSVITVKARVATVLAAGTEPQISESFWFPQLRLRPIKPIRR